MVRIICTFLTNLWEKSFAKQEKETEAIVFVENQCGDDDDERICMKFEEFLQISHSLRRAQHIESVAQSFTEQIIAAASKNVKQTRHIQSVALSFTEQIIAAASKNVKQTRHIQSVAQSFTQDVIAQATNNVKQTLNSIMALNITNYGCRKLKQQFEHQSKVIREELRAEYEIAAQQQRRQRLDKLKTKYNTTSKKLLSSEKEKVLLVNKVEQLHASNDTLKAEANKTFEIRYLKLKEELKAKSKKNIQQLRQDLSKEYSTKLEKAKKYERKLIANVER